MADWTIYHNPRCSKSRQTLGLLRGRGAEPEVVEYLKTPPDAAGLRSIAGKLGLRPVDFLRKNEPVFRELEIDTNDDDAVIRAMAEHPILIERPIVVRGGRAVIGRPPENVEDLIERPDRKK